MQEGPPDDVAALWLAAMRRGDWAEAWRQTDRIELPRRASQARDDFAREPRHLLWDGTPFAGRSVLVRCEHGLGDTLQFIRFVPRLSRMARHVSVRVQPPLLGLLSGAPGLGAVGNAWSAEAAPAHDVAIEVMELPYALRSSIANLPPPYPHLRAKVAGTLDFDWPRDERLRVGLVWAASDWDRSRSIPPALMEPLLRVDEVRFFSLQQGEAAHDALSMRLVALSRHTGDIAAAAAAMLALDLVISVDAMAAHLAATLGRPTWLLLKHDADWRWMRGRGDSPWYPAMRLFRQPAPGDWRSVIAAATRALREQAKAHRTQARESFSPRRAPPGR